MALLAPWSSFGRAGHASDADYLKAMASWNEATIRAMARLAISAVHEKFTHRHANVSHDLAEQDRRNVTTLMERNCRSATICVSELLMTTFLPCLAKPETLKNGDRSHAPAWARDQIEQAGSASVQLFGEGLRFPDTALAGMARSLYLEMSGG